MSHYRAYPTPEGATNSDRVCRSFAIRASLIPMFDDWIEKITYPSMWEQVGDMTPDEVGEEIEQALAQLQARGCAVWIGEVRWIATDIPDWCLLCDGQEYDKDDYPELAAVLDMNYETSPLTFRVPSLIERTMRGGLLPGGQGGEATHTLTEAEMPVHVHGYIPPTINPDVEGPGIPDIGATVIGLGAFTDSAGGGQPHNNWPPYEYLVPVIVARWPNG